MYSPLYKFIVITIALSSNSVLACPDGQYSQNIGLGSICVPEIGGAVGDAAEHVKRETVAHTGGPALEVWINQSRNSAIGTSDSIPPQIRHMLTGYIEDDILNRVRYKIGDNGILNLAGLTLDYGDKVYGNEIAAITLNDVIVFRDTNSASDLGLWAHELTHVKQYRDWGVHDFAIRYVRNSDAVEDPAREVGAEYDAWRQRTTANLQAMQPRFQPQFQPQTIQRLGVFCYTQVGRFGPGQSLPIGAPCNVQTPGGVVNGQIGQ